MDIRGVSREPALTAFGVDSEWFIIPADLIEVGQFCQAFGLPSVKKLTSRLSCWPPRNLRPVISPP